MKIAVLGNQPGWSFADLQRAADNQCELEFVAWSELTAIVGEEDSVNANAGPFDVCLIRGMPQGTLEQVIFQMNALARWQAGGMTVINSPRSLEVAIDKYLSLALMCESGLPVPPSIVGQTVDSAMRAFALLGNDVVIKPVFGGEGRGLVRVTDPEIAGRSFRAIVNYGGVVFLQQYIDSRHQDFRLLLIGDQVLAMKRFNPGDWRTNASRGAICEPFAPDQNMVDLAFRAAEAVGTRIAGVDLIQCGTGEVLVLEVNGVPGWKMLGDVCKVDVSRQVLDWIVQEQQAKKDPQIMADYS